MALGDSYSSGEGLGNYDLSWAYDSHTWEYDSQTNESNPNHCHRHRNAYPSLFSGGFQYGVPAFHACSGAVTRDVLDRSRYGEMPQVQRLKPATSLVTITVGGNDAGFTQVLGDCGIPACDEQYQQNVLENVIPGIKDNLIGV